MNEAVDIFRMKSTIEDIIKDTLKENPKATMAYVLNNIHYEIGRGKYDVQAEREIKKTMTSKERDDWFQRLAEPFKLPKGKLMESFGIGSFGDYQDDLNEVLITLGNKAYPQFGNIVILAGGAGSGKGFVKDKLLGIDGKSLDVDALKALAMASKDIRRNVITAFGVDINKLDLTIPENVSKLHVLMDDIKLPSRREKALYTSILTAPADRKPNIIFDVTLKDMKKFIKIAEKASELGYAKENIHIVWVVNDVKVAMEQNKDVSRGRVVPEDILIDTHKGASMTMFSIINESQKLRKYMDGAVVLAFNKKKVDSELAFAKDFDFDKFKGGMYVVKALYIVVKEKGKAVDTSKLTKEIKSKLQAYTPDTVGSSRAKTNFPEE